MGGCRKWKKNTTIKVLDQIVKALRVKATDFFQFLRVWSRKILQFCKIFGLFSEFMIFSGGLLKLQLVKEML